MLQQSANPPQITPMAPRSHRLSSQITSSSLDLIDSNIGPLGFEPDLLAEVFRLRSANDVRGMVALFTAYKDVAELFIRMMNQPYVDQVQILEDEYARAWSKAYLVADHLKSMQPTNHIEKQFMAEALFSCAIMMGHKLQESISVVEAVAAMPETDPIKGVR
ncbi:hypothetical protein SAMN05216374_1003 [Tardiphaga sp. OK246]|uniref:hypothetical protein n=1 Tax=Tardiphaga sp. OK246 TaxID=1855307 RepID=UPI000B6379E2|nr:hypothetical protein [Tardiphaga sp. OK246]SNS36810.1 hypothetical protein SAMN05216374_1003 [Tardiphaga sp. OK246]